MRKTNSTHRMKLFGVDDVLIGAAIGGLGSFFTNQTNKENVEATNQANAAQAQANRDFQERMSNTAYQRGMADMKAAGLNPILAYQKGGASSPGGAQAAMQTFEAKNVAEHAVTTGLALQRANAETDKIRQDTQTSKADEQLKLISSAAQRANTQKMEAETAIRTLDLSDAELRSLKARLDKDVYTNSAGAIARRAGTASEEAARTYEPVVNSASKLLRGYNDTRTRRSTTETNHYQDQSFSERFHY